MGCRFKPARYIVRLLPFHKSKYGNDLLRFNVFKRHVHASFKKAIRIAFTKYRYYARNIVEPLRYGQFSFCKLLRKVCTLLGPFSHYLKRWVSICLNRHPTVGITILKLLSVEWRMLSVHSSPPPSTAFKCKSCWPLRLNMDSFKTTSHINFYGVTLTGRIIYILLVNVRRGDMYLTIQTGQVGVYGFPFIWLYFQGNHIFKWMRDNIRHKVSVRIGSK